MIITLRKSITAWVKSHAFLPICLLAIPILYFVPLHPESRFSISVPLLLIIFSLINLWGIAVFLHWLFFQPNKITVDFTKGEFRGPKSLLYRFDIWHCCRIQSHSHSNNLWYRIFFEHSARRNVFHLPQGYLADVPYQQVIDYLEQQQRPFRLEHAPWLFKEKQAEEDKARDKRGEAILKKQGAQK